MWVALAGPLTHIPMVIFWICMMLIATKVAYGTAFVSLYTPYPSPKELGVALTAGAIAVSRGGIGKGTRRGCYGMCWTRLMACEEDCYCMQAGRWVEAGIVAGVSEIARFSY